MVVIEKEGSCGLMYIAKTNGRKANYWYSLLCDCIVYYFGGEKCPLKNRVNLLLYQESIDIVEKVADDNFFFVCSTCGKVLSCRNIFTHECSPMIHSEVVSIRSER